MKYQSPDLHWIHHISFKNTQLIPFFWCLYSSNFYTIQRRHIHGEKHLFFFSFVCWTISHQKKSIGVGVMKSNNLIDYNMCRCRNRTTHRLTRYRVKRLHTLSRYCRAHTEQYTARRKNRSYLCDISLTNTFIRLGRVVRPFLSHKLRLFCRFVVWSFSNALSLYLSLSQRAQYVFVHAVGQLCVFWPNIGNTICADYYTNISNNDNLVLGLFPLGRLKEKIPYYIICDTVSFIHSLAITANSH